MSGLDRASVALLVVALTTCGSPHSPPVGDVVPFEEVYSLPSFSGLTSPTAALIVDSASWDAAWASIFSNYGPSQRPPLPAINFDSTVVLYAGTGEVPTQLYSFKITEVRLSDAGTLNVRVESVWPTCGSLPVITSPVHVVSVRVQSTTARFTWVKSGKCD
jgi:hypothetical protein